MCKGIYIFIIIKSKRGREKWEKLYYYIEISILIKVIVLRVLNLFGKLRRKYFSWYLEKLVL